MFSTHNASYGPDKELKDAILARKFTTIYRAAYENDEEKLKQILSFNTCIDEYDNRRAFTPASKLASEGNIAALELLIKYGASPNSAALGAGISGHHIAEMLRKKYSIDISVLAKGAIIGGHIEYAEKLRIYHGANVSIMAVGAVLSGRKEYAERLRVKYHACATLMAAAAAESGDVDYAEELRIHHGALWKEIASSAASVFNTIYSEKLREEWLATSTKQEVNTVIHEEILRNNSIIASGAAFGGNISYAELLRKEHGAYPFVLATYAAMGGNLEYAEFLRKLVTNQVNQNPSDEAKAVVMAVLDGIVSQAAASGYCHYVENLRKFCNADVHNSAIGAVGGEQNKYAAHLLVEGADYTKSWDMAWKIFNLKFLNEFSIHHPYRHFSISQTIEERVSMRQGSILPVSNNQFENEKTLTYSLSFIDNKNFRCFTINLLRKCPEIQGKFQWKKIQWRVNHINSLMENEGMNYDQAFSWIQPEIKTLILQCYRLITEKNIPFAIFTVIVSFVSECSISLPDANDLFTKGWWKHKHKKQYQEPLVEDLIKYSGFSNPLFSVPHSVYHRERAISLLHACKKMHSLEEISNLLKFQKGLFDKTINFFQEKSTLKHETGLISDKKDDFYRIIDTHLKKIGAS